MVLNVLLQQLGILHALSKDAIPTYTLEYEPIVVIPAQVIDEFLAKHARDIVRYLWIGAGLGTDEGDEAKKKK